MPVEARSPVNSAGFGSFAVAPDGDIWAAEGGAVVRMHPEGGVAKVVNEYPLTRNPAPTTTSSAMTEISGQAAHRPLADKPSSSWIFGPANSLNLSCPAGCLPQGEGLIAMATPGSAAGAVPSSGSTPDSANAGTVCARPENLD
jgi:hypothetical protein